MNKDSPLPCPQSVRKETKRRRNQKIIQDTKIQNSANLYFIINPSLTRPRIHQHFGDKENVFSWKTSKKELPLQKVNYF